MFNDVGDVGAGAIYICTEDAFPSRRLKQMVDRLQLRSHPPLSSVLMDNVFVEHAADLVKAFPCSFLLPVPYLTIWSFPQNLSQALERITLRRLLFSLSDVYSVGSYDEVSVAFHMADHDVLLHCVGLHGFLPLC